MAAQQEENLVSLKVMRLCRPSLVQQQPVPLPSEAVGMPSPGAASSIALTGWLTLPQSFGDIFLGETFSCYISLANVSGGELTQIALKVEVQTQVQRETLSAQIAPPAGDSTPEVDTLQVGQTLDQIIKYELKDVGVHILICSASFCDRDGERKFRKFFKFQVHNPLTMKSKTHPLGASEEILVETQLQNATSRILFLESVAFTPAGGFEVTPLTSFGAAAIDEPPIVLGGAGPCAVLPVAHGDQRPTRTGVVGRVVPPPDPPRSGSVGLPAFGALAYLKPGDTQQHMYRLRPRPPTAVGARAPSALGRMDVLWRGAMGEAGHLQSSTVQRRAPPARALEISVLSSPASVPIQTPFTVSCAVTNTTGMARELSVRSSASASSLPIVPTGSCSHRLAPLAPGATLYFSLAFLGIEPGVQTPAGVTLVDVHTGEATEIEPLAPVLVVEAE